MPYLRIQPSMPLPMTLPGLVGWWSPFDPANDGSQPANNSAVANYINKTANGINFAQANGASQPLYPKTALNGKPALSFGGLQNMTATATSPTWLNFSTNFTIYGIFKLDSASNTNQAIISKGTSNSTPNWVVDVNRGSANGKLSIWDGADWTDSDNSFNDVADWSMYGISWNGTTLNVLLDNALTTVTGTFNNVTSTTQPLVLGAFGTGTPAHLLDGLLGDQLIYAAPHTLNQMALVHFFFANFYGLNF